MGDPLLGQPASSTVVAGRSFGRPFVGRDQELTQLAFALDDATSGRGALVLVTGEPGIGKTRLLAELAQLASERGVRVVSGRCWEEGGAPPYWPWIQVVRAVGGDLEQLAGSREVDGGRSSAGSAVVPEGERLRLFDAVAQFLEAAALDEPLLVTLDDVHAADEPSLLLLRFLGDALATANVLLVASYREGETRVRELAQVFAELARVGWRLPLRGLTPADVGDYLASVTGSPPSERIVARLHEITGGNPFFVGEVVRLLLAEDALERLDQAIKDPLLRVPEEVRTLIRRRVASLAPEASSVLRVAAVIGREFDLNLLQRMSRLTPDRLLDVLGEAVGLGVVIELQAAPGRYAFAHELVRETLYDDLPAGRRLELHRQVGAVLEGAYADDLDPHLSEIARHLYLGAPLGDAERAHEYQVRAGDRACAALAYEEAALHYRHALELFGQIGESGARRGELLLRLGDAEWRSGDGAEARTTFEEALTIGRRLGDGKLLARAALGYVTALGGFLLYARFEVGGTGVGLLQEALAALPSEDDPLRARLLAHLALEMWSANEPVEQRVAVSREAIEMARRVGDSEALVTALHARHWVLTTPGMAFERIAHTEEMLRVARERVNPELEFLARNARFHCFLELCDRRGIDAEAQAMSELAERLRQPFYRWHTVCLRALRATLDGRFDDAERLAGEALELGRLRRSEYATYVYRYAQMLAIRWAQGRLPEFWPEIADHAERFPWIPRWREPFAAAELGEKETARAEVERFAAGDFSGLARDGLWLLHMCSLAEACVVVGDDERAGRLYELLLPHADENAVTYTQQPFGPVALRLGQLAALLRRWQEADRHFATALARCELLGARAIRARVLLEHARALAAKGEPADEKRLEALLNEATQLCEELGMSGLAVRVAAVRTVPASQPSGAVFRREGDVWTIAYAGRSARVRDVKGLRYLAALLASPGRDVHVLELVATESGLTADVRFVRGDDGLDGVSVSAAGALLDEKAKDAYRQRLVELDEEIEEARAWADLERRERLGEERELLVRELARAVGLRGRDRTFSSPAERARISVTKAIRTAIRLIGRHCPELASHLEDSVQTGRFCSYAPRGAAPPSWTL